MDIKDKLKSINDRPVSTIPVPEWGMDLYFRQLSLRERLTLAERIDAGGNLDFGTLLCALVCDEDGSRVFTLDEGEYFDDKHPDTIRRLGEEALAFAKLRPEDRENDAKN